MHINLMPLQQLYYISGFQENGKVGYIPSSVFVMDPLPFCNSLFILKEWKPNAKKRIIMQISRNLIFREDSSFFKMFHLKQIRFCSGEKKSKNEIKIKDVFKFCLQKCRKPFQKSCVGDIGYNKLNFLRCIIKSCVCVAVQILQI